MDMTLQRPELSVYETSAAYLRFRLKGAGLPQTPDVAVILGSGLGAFAYSDAVQSRVVIPYGEIPHFPRSTVSYQKGELVAGMVGERCVLLFSGRFHYYEGWELWQTAYPVVVCSLLGCHNMIITNAAGGISADRLTPGDLVCITDHIKLCADSPLRGRNEDALGERFFDMQSVYDKAFSETAADCARRLGIDLKRGVYAYMTGPQFETPAEIRMLSLLGADVVGMSTVPEVIEAAHCGTRVLCISCVTNLAAGVTGAPMSEEEVLEVSGRTSDRFRALLGQVIKELPLT